MSIEAGLSEREQLEVLFKAHFVEAGFPYVELPLIEKTDSFLDLMSDEVRRKTHAFPGQDGQEYWVRSDFTLSACRRFANSYASKGEAKLSYSGPVYRNQSYDRGVLQRGMGAETLHAGIEFIRPKNELEADANVVALAEQAVRKAKVQSYKMIFGDLSLFSAIVEGLELPAISKTRLLSRFWRQSRADRFIWSLRNESEKRGQTRPLIALLSRGNTDEARDAILELFSLADIQPVGQRPLEEIIERLLEQAADATALGLSKNTISVLEEFFKIDGPIQDSLSNLKTLSREAVLKIEPQIERLEKRFSLMASAGVDLSNGQFKTQLGKETGYYTGFCFEIWDLAPAKTAPRFAAGGRYDKLIKMLGAPEDCPAVGTTVFVDGICERFKS